MCIANMPWLWTYWCAAAGFAEASCRSQIRTAKAVVEEMGPAKASEGGLLEWAAIHECNSERDAQKVVAKQGTILKVPISSLAIQGENISWICPKDWIQYIVDSGQWCHLAGLKFEERHEAPNMWRQFWDKWEVLHPHFGFFERSPCRRDQTAAMWIHGDEGRTLKRSALMVTSIQSALGAGFRSERVLPMKHKHDGSLIQNINYEGLSFCTRFVSSVLPKRLYESNSTFFDDVMEATASSLSDLLEHGVQDRDGNRYYVCILGIKGDLPYLNKVGHLQRNFMTGNKNGKEQANPKGICYKCLAGIPGFEYENLACMEAPWRRTIGLEVPWDRPCAFISKLVHDQSDPSTYFFSDIWHNMHLGAGKAWVASTVLLALKDLDVFCRNLPAKWDWLTNDYLTFCSSTRVQPHVRTLTPVMMGLYETGGPIGAWSKGAMTTALMKWLPHMLSKLSPQPGSDLEKAMIASTSINRFFSILYSSPFFVAKDVALLVFRLGTKWLLAYKQLAASSYANGRVLYPLTPKLHEIDHAITKVLHDAENHGYAVNPVAWACQQDEDLVGRASRLSRRVSSRQVIHRCLQRYLIQVHTTWKCAGLIR